MPFPLPAPPHGQTSARPFLRSISLVPNARPWRSVSRSPFLIEPNASKIRPPRNIRQAKTKATAGSSRTPPIPTDTPQGPLRKKDSPTDYPLGGYTTVRARRPARAAEHSGKKRRRRKSGHILESYEKDLFSCRFADAEPASANGSKGRKPERHDTGATQRPALFP